MKNAKKWIAVLALILWVSSFFLPTTRHGFSVIQGYEVFAMGLQWPWVQADAAMLAKGLLLFVAWLTNIVFLSQVFKPLRGSVGTNAVRYVLVFLSGLLNVAVVAIYSSSPKLNSAVFAHVFEYPGVYLWFASFFVLGSIHDLGRMLGAQSVSDGGPHA